MDKILRVKHTPFLDYAKALGTPNADTTKFNEYHGEGLWKHQELLDNPLYKLIGVCDNGRKIYRHIRTHKTIVVGEYTEVVNG